jgi:hypothetical protein
MDCIEKIRQCQGQCRLANATLAVYHRNRDHRLVPVHHCDFQCLDWSNTPHTREFAAKIIGNNHWVTSQGVTSNNPVQRCRASGTRGRFTILADGTRAALPLGELPIRVAAKLCRQGRCHLLGRISVKRNNLDTVSVDKCLDRRRIVGVTFLPSQL